MNTAIYVSVLNKDYYHQWHIEVGKRRRSRNKNGKLNRQKIRAPINCNNKIKNPFLVSHEL